jgi:hypothetical protein
MLGKKSGEVKMIRNGDNVEAYQVFVNLLFIMLY